ncbi:MAG TPA: multiheme c-type cytochrome [Anaerolineales bacterium]
MHRSRAIFLIGAAALCLSGAAWGFGPGAKGYTGSEKCRDCHEGIYRQWRVTPHANMLRDAAKNAEAVAAKDFSGVPFKREDIRWSIGSHWIQKYLTFIDNDYFVLPKYWNLVSDNWEPYSIFNWREQPYTIYCDGCHTTGFDPATRSFHEPSIGCEACHGPGEKHLATGSPGDIVNPGKLEKERRDMICESCHTDGKDTQAGGQFPFPALYRPGEDLTRYFSDFFAPKPKSKKWYRGTMDYKERHRMFLFWQSKFYSTARACDICGFDRGITVKEERYMSRDEYCGTCHAKIYKLSSVHTRHPSRAVQCIDCHAPQVTDGGSRYSIHDHKFDFSGPEMPCVECHEAKETEGKNAEAHDFHFDRVRTRENLTLEQSCLKCHPEKDIRETLKDWRVVRGAGN